MTQTLANQRQHLGQLRRTAGILAIDADLIVAAALALGHDRLAQAAAHRVARHQGL